MRAFLAVEPSPEVLARLVEMKAELAHHQAPVRWARDDQLHVTVKFLGNVAEDAMAQLCDALAPLAATPPLAAQVGGLGAFPDLRRPRVLWAGVRCPGLTDVARDVETAAARLGVAPETRPFHAHVTLGRVKEIRRDAPLLRAIAAGAATELGACAFAELIAFRSDLRPGGALYTKQWSIPFGG